MGSRIDDIAENLQQPEWSAGRSAGFGWAVYEARRGYLHPLRPDAGRMRVVIEHARQAFGGLACERRPAFIRGFIQGAADFWRLQMNGERPC